MLFTYGTLSFTVRPIQHILYSINIDVKLANSEDAFSPRNLVYGKPCFEIEILYLQRFYPIKRITSYEDPEQAQRFPV